jgi:hypothetical protein
MARPRRATTVAAILLAVGALALVAIPAAIAAFGARSQNAGNSITAAPDFVAPAITAVAIGKVEGGVTGYVRKGGRFFVYANVSADTGSPASGLSTVKANAGEFGAGAAVPLTAGSYTAGGVSYNYRSAELTDVLQTGTRGFTVTATDLAGNAGTLEGSATADTTPPAATDIQTANHGTTVGRPEEKDTVTYTFSEPIEPQSILAGWNGSATGVVVRVADNGLLGLSTGNDELLVYNAANSIQLPLGTVNLGRGDYVAGLLGGYITFGASGTASTMTMSGNTITITLGTLVGVLVGPTTAAGTGTMTWTPVSTPYDRAANAASTTAVAESGSADKDF